MTYLRTVVKSTVPYHLGFCHSVGKILKTSHELQRIQNNFHFVNLLCQ